MEKLDNVNAKELWAIARRRNFTMWGELDGDWKHIVKVDGDNVTINDWQLPSEIGTEAARKVVQLGRFAGFDLTS